MLFRSTSLKPLFEALVEVTPAPTHEPGHPLQLLVTTLDYNDYVGRLAVGRVFHGKLRKGGDIAHCRLDGTVARSRITLGVLERMLNSLIPTKGRKSVILVSDGFIYDTNMDEFKDVTQASRRANAAVYFVDASGLGGLPDSFSAEFGAPIDARDVGSALLDSSLKAEGSTPIRQISSRSRKHFYKRFQGSRVPGFRGLVPWEFQ